MMLEEGIIPISLMKRPRTKDYSEFGCPLFYTLDLLFLRRQKGWIRGFV